MVEQPASRDVDQEARFGPAAQDLEFLAPKEVARRRCQRQADDQRVEPGGQERVQCRLRRSAVPGLRDRAVRVARAGDEVACVGARGRRRARRRGVCVDGGAERGEDAGGFFKTRRRLEYRGTIERHIQG